MMAVRRTDLACPRLNPESIVNIEGQIVAPKTPITGCTQSHVELAGQTVRPIALPAPYPSHPSL